MNDTPTPRTDAFMRVLRADLPAIANLADFARSLERELAETKDRMQCGALASDYAQKCFALEAERDAALAALWKCRGVLDMASHFGYFKTDESLEIAFQVADALKAANSILNPQTKCHQKKKQKSLEFQ